MRLDGEHEREALRMAKTRKEERREREWPRPFFQKIAWDRSR